MDCKLTSQPIKVNKTLLRQTIEQPYDEQLALPDYCPDIRRVLKCRIVPKIAQKSATGGCINLDGVACLMLIYVDTDGEIRSFEAQSSFTRSIELSTDCDDVAVSAKCRTDYCNCRAKSERAIEVHAAMSISVVATACAEVKIITDIDEPSVQLKRGSVPAVMPQGRAEKYLLINDEVSLPDKCPSIRSILRHDAVAVIKDKKIVGSKAVIKGEIIINVLYFGEETADCERFSEAIPFSQILDIQGVTEDCSLVAAAELISAELFARTGMSGDMRVVSVSAKLCLTATAYCNGEVPYITDAYSTQYEMPLKTDEISFEKIAASYSEPFEVKKTLDIPVAKGAQIVDMWCYTVANSCSGDQTGVTVKGSVTYCLILRDAGGEASYYERVYDFECKIPASMPPSYSLKCTADVVSCSGLITLDGIEVKAELLIACDIVEQLKQSVVVEAELGEKKPRRHSRSSVIVYFATDAESLWDIARRYSTSPEAIAAVNSLKTDIIPAAKTIVIPSV